MRVELRGLCTHEVKKNSRTGVNAELDLGDLELKRQVSQSFDDLVALDWYKHGNLYELQKLRLLLRENGILRLVNTYAGKIDQTYLFHQEILLNKAGFVDLRIQSDKNPLIIEARKRPLVTEEYEYGFTLTEIVDPDEIFACHEFAKEYYYYKDFNYDLDIVRQFDLNADLMIVRDGSGEICSMVRSILRVPGYYCPFMYAVDPNGDHYTVPKGFMRFSEMMALYKEGKKGVVAFKRIMESLTQYTSYIERIDSIWTTYDESDSYTGTYYKTKFLMEELGVRLKFRDFGGSWNLLVTDKIEKLRRLHKDLFKR